MAIMALLNIPRASLNKAFFHLLAILFSGFHRLIQRYALTVAGQAGHCPSNLADIIPD